MASWKQIMVSLLIINKSMFFLFDIFSFYKQLFFRFLEKEYLLYAHSIAYADEREHINWQSVNSSDLDILK